MKNRSWRSFGHHGVLLLALLVGLLIALPASAQSPVNTKLLTLIDRGDSGISFELGQNLAAPNPSRRSASFRAPCQRESLAQAARCRGGTRLEHKPEGPEEPDLEFPTIYPEWRLAKTAGGLGSSQAPLSGGVDATADLQSNPAGAALAFSLEVSLHGAGPCVPVGRARDVYRPWLGHYAGQQHGDDRQFDGAVQTDRERHRGRVSVTASATVTGNMTETAFRWPI